MFEEDAEHLQDESISSSHWSIRVTWNSFRFRTPLSFDSDRLELGTLYFVLSNWYFVFDNKNKH